MPEELNTPAAQSDSETDPETVDEGPSDPALEAVNICRRAYSDAYDAYQVSRGGPGKALESFGKQIASKAYRDSLPTLSSRQDILNFIACVAEGILLDAIPEKTSTKLIYAAQVALGALPREPKPRKITKKRTPPHPRGAKKGNREEAQATSSAQAA